MANHSNQNTTTKLDRDLEATQIINMTQSYPSTKNRVSEEELKQKIEQPNWGNLKSSFSNLSVLGMGGMGTVFSAKDTLFYRNLALKIMRSDLRNNEESINSFLREARITAQIDHPNVVPVYNLGVFDGTGAYFSMKKIEGETLEYVLKKLSINDENYQKKYSLRRRLEIFINICNGVAFAHSKGVIHRDLKPANIMLGNYGEVFIMDWGMALYIEQNDLSTKGKKIDLREEFVEKNKNVIAGTPLFLSPEQICGCEREFGESSDVYSLGNILYCLLCSTVSVHEPTLETEVLLNKIVDGEIIRPRKRAKNIKLQKELEAICLKALEVDRDYRYQSATELLTDIRNYLDLQVVGINNSPMIRFIKYCRRHPMIPSAVFAALLTIVVFFSYFYISDRLEYYSLVDMVKSYNNECINLLAQQKRLLNVRNSAMNSNDINYGIMQVANNSELILNEAQFFDATIQELDALLMIENLTYAPKITEYKKELITVILQYYSSSTSQSNFNKIIGRLKQELPKEFYSITLANRELRERLRLLEANSGKLEILTNEELTLSVSYQNRDNLGSEKNSFTINSPFEKTLVAGTYIFTLRNSSNQKVSIPIKINAGDNLIYNLEIPTQIPNGMVYIPAGEYLSNILSINDLGYNLKVNEFFLKENEVTFGEYLEFWNTLEDDELKTSYTAVIIDHFNGIKAVPLWDKNGVIIAPFQSNLPIRGISIEAMEEYCKYLSKKTDRQVRLPYFHELEKAARGVDNRLHVWGDTFNKEFALLSLNSQSEKYKFGAIGGTFISDRSVYGVNDLAGNLREIVKYIDRDIYGVYGGSFLTDNLYAKCSNVYSFTGNTNDIGFRYVVEIDPKERLNEEEK